MGYDDLVDQLYDDIHSLKNVMTLSPDMHSAFDSLKLWFEPVVSYLKPFFA
jgi:HNH endonuclease